MDIIKLKTPNTIAKDALKSILKVVIQPTVVGDGTRQARLHASRLLVERLAPFLAKRFGNPSGVVVEKIEAGPVLKKESLLLPPQP